MNVGDLPHQRQSEAQTAAGTRFFKAVEAVPDLFQLGGRDALAVVGYGEYYPLMLPVKRDAYLSAAVFEGVFQKIAGQP